MKRIVKYILFSSFVFLFAGVFGVRAADWPANGGTDIGTDLVAGYEPSGIVWHDRLERLFLVGDDGDVTKMTSTGTIESEWSYGSAFDLEGAAIANSSSNYIYLGMENPDSIYEFDINSNALSGKSWDLTSWMSGADYQGLEALTFVPNGYHPYANSNSGGLFYAGLQIDGKIYVFDVDLSQSGQVSHVDTITPRVGLIDISGLHFHVETSTLYAIFDGFNLILEMQADGTFLQEYTLAGSAQEGVTLKPACPNASTNIFIAQDSGEVYSYANYPIYSANCQTEEEKEVEQEEENFEQGDEITLSPALNSVTLHGQSLVMYFKKLPNKLTKNSQYWMLWKKFDKYPKRWNFKKRTSLKRYWRLTTNLRKYKANKKKNKFKIKIAFKYSKKLLNKLKKKNSTVRKKDLRLKYRTKKGNKWKLLKNHWKKVKVEHRKKKRRFVVRYFKKFEKKKYYFAIGLK